MMRNFRENAKKLDSEQISTRVLVALVTLSVLVFVAFFFIGYDIPYDADPTFNAPLLTDVVLVFMYVLIAAATALAAISVTLGIKKRDKSQGVVNNIPAAKISLYTIALLLCCMIATFILGSSDPVPVNGVKFTDKFWLKATDMFINTSLILLAVAVCVVAFGVSGYNRKIKKIKI